MAPPETRETRGAAHGHSTVLFGLVGQASDYTLAKVTFTGDSAAGHASLVTIAAEALGVPTPSELGARSGRRAECESREVLKISSTCGAQ